MDVKALAPEKLVAHRGHQARFPENSLLGLMDAIAAGALNIELDIQMTRDAVPVLYHDQHMQRISGIDQSISDINASQLKHYLASEPERLQTRYSGNAVSVVEEVLPQIQKHKHIHFFIELKEESIDAHGSSACLEALQSTLAVNGQLSDNLVFISFHPQSVKQARHYGFKKTALVFRDWAARNALLTQSLADFGFINHKRIPQNTAIVADKPLILYEIADLALAHSLLDRGAAAIETFCIRRMLGNE